MFHPFSIQIDWSVVLHVVVMLVDAIDMLSGDPYNILCNDRTLRQNFKIHNVICMFVNKNLFPD
jgi:hypothetical protein